MISTFASKLSTTYFLKNGFLVLFEKGILMGKGVLIAYLLANYVEREVLGTYQYITAILGLVAVVSFPGMGTAIVQAVARGFDGTLYNGTIVSLKRSLFGSLILFLGSFYYFVTNQTDLSTAFLLIALLTPFSIVTAFLRQYYVAKENFIAMVKVTLLIETVTLISFVVAILFFPNLTTLLLTSVVASSLLGLVWMIPLLKRVRDEASEPSNIEYGKRLSWSYVVTILSTNLDKVILASMLGFSEVALYAIAMIIPEQARASLATIPLLLLPKFSREDNGSYGRKFVTKFFFTSGLIAIILSIAYYFLAPIVFSFLFSEYTEAIVMSRILFLVTLSIPFLVLDTYYRSKKADRVILQSTLWGSIGGIGLMPVLIFLYGIQGAIAAKLIGYLLTGVFLGYRFFYQKS